jgi:hypothetical protein
VEEVEVVEVVEVAEVAVELWWRSVALRHRPAVEEACPKCLNAEQSRGSRGQT